MKKKCALVVCVLFCLIFSCLSAMAQWPPQPCCPWTPRIIQAGGMPTLQATLEISNQVLQIQGLSRDQFLDQVSNVFFPGKTTEMVILSKQVTSKPGANDSGWTLMAAEETLYYRTSRASITADYLNSLTEFGLTDGNTWIKINVKDEKNETTGGAMGSAIERFLRR
jgi:hypothetical protein